MSEEALRQARAAGTAVEEVLGRSVRSVLRLAGSVANRDHLVRLDDGSSVVLKEGPADELAREAWTLRRLGDRGLPVPAVLAAAESATLGAPVLVLALVPGSADPSPGVLAVAGAAIRAVHTERLPGFGPLDPGDGVGRGRFRTWREAVASTVSAVPALVAAGVLEAELAGRAVGLATGPLTDYRGGGVLLHRDLKEAHLFGDTGALTGVIDWGDVWVGDPLVDLARMSMAPAPVFDAFLDGYGRPEVADLTYRLTAYRIGWNLDALGYELRAGGDWFQVYRDRVAADVALLDAPLLDDDGRDRG